MSARGIDCYSKGKKLSLKLQFFFGEAGGIVPGVFNRWKPAMIGNSIDQSITLVHWYRLVSANRWPIDNHTKPVHRLLSIGSATSNRRHARYLSDHPPFLGSTGDEIGKTNSDPVFSTQRIYLVGRVLELPTSPSLPFRVIMSTQDVQVEALLNI